MSCPHRFLGLHITNSLFPDWEFDTLIIGTFNPEWKFSKGQNADYFYGRTSRNYFWDVLPEVFGFDKLRNSNKDKWIKFLKKNKIGLTDLLLNIGDAVDSNTVHYNYLKTKADINIAKFSDLVWNTNNITSLIKQGKIKSIYITNLSSPVKFEEQFNIIKSAAIDYNIIFERLVTPSFMCRFYFKGNKCESLYSSLFNFWKSKIKIL
jgi:hypothetical protein